MSFGCLQNTEQKIINKKDKGIVFNIQKFTVHDGPGIRTEIFLKGCHLRCRWCSNPESFVAQSQIGVYQNNCITLSKCGKCLEICEKAKEGALVINEDKIVSINRDVCTNCLKCKKICPTNALKQWGEEMSVDEVMEVILSDKCYYDKSGGGVTISGGESLYQHKFTTEILRACKKENIHTCVETALHVKSNILDEIIPFTDMFITDIKHLNPIVHKQYTEVDNTIILENIKKIVKSGVPVVLRIPIIPNINDSKEHIEQISDFILSKLNNKLVQVQFLRFRRLGEEKYKSLGLDYKMEEVNPNREDFENHIKELVQIMANKGIPAVAGTTNKIKIN